MIYIIISADNKNPGRVSLTKYEGVRTGGREHSIEEKIPYDDFNNFIFCSCFHILSLFLYRFIIVSFKFIEGGNWCSFIILY